MRSRLIRTAATVAAVVGVILAVSPPSALWWTPNISPLRWQISHLGSPEQALAAAEARWRAELADRGSTIHPEGRCYFNIRSDGRIHLTNHLFCGPVAHWVGTVEPQVTPSPTAYSHTGGRLFGPDYTPITARPGRWDVYSFTDIDRQDDKLAAKAPRGVFLGVGASELQLWRPDGLTPPADLGAGLTGPTPPPRAVIPPPTRVLIDINHTYRPPAYHDGDLAVSYRLDIHGAEWTLDQALAGQRRLVLDIDMTAETTPGYRVTGSIGDMATAVADDGATATPAGGTAYRLDTDQTPHQLVFALAADTAQIELTVSPVLRFSAQNTGFQPRTGRVELPSDTITLHLTADGN